VKRISIVGAAIAAVSSALTGCSSTKVTYVDSRGAYGKGIMAGGFASMNSGRFSITDAGVTCSGNYASWDKGDLKFPVWCTDGASGTVAITRQDGVASNGTLHLTSGETRSLVFDGRQ